MKALTYCSAGILAVCLSTQAQAELVARDDIVAFDVPQRFNFTLSPLRNDSGVNGDITLLPEELNLGSTRTEQGGSIRKITSNAQAYFYTPPQNPDPNGGSDAFTYTVRDNATGETATARFNIIFVPAPAVKANSDWFNAASGVETKFAINANDTVNINRSFENTANPWSLRGGTVKFGTGDNKDLLIYKSKAGFTGQDKVWYTLKGPNLTTDWAEVTINVVGDRAEGPVTGIIDTVTVERTSTGNFIDVLANDIGVSDGGGFLNSPNPWTLRAGRVFENRNTLNYTPNPSFIGQDKLWYTFSSNGGSGWGEVRIDVQNRGIPPYPRTQPDIAAATSGKTIEINLLGNDFGDRLTLDMPSPYSQKGGLVAVGSTKTVFYRSKPGFTGQDKFWYTIKDGAGNQNWGEVTINVR